MAEDKLHTAPTKTENGLVSAANRFHSAGFVKVTLVVGLGQVADNYSGMGGGMGKFSVAEIKPYMRDSFLSDFEKQQIALFGVADAVFQGRTLLEHGCRTAGEHLAINFFIQHVDEMRAVNAFG